MEQKGLRLAVAFYTREVKQHLKGIPHAAGRLDEGSEVLSFDTPMSHDHDWGPQRLQIFVEEARGGPIAGIQPVTTREFLLSYLGYDINEPLTAADWLSFSQQKLATVRHGALFQDQIGLNRLRAKLKWYPHDVWLYQLASVWHRIGQEEHLVGRAGYVGDELGAKIIASRLVRDAMRLCLMMQKEYAPYPKWFGSMFRAYEHIEEEPIGGLLERVLAAEEWKERDRRLAQVYEALVRRHNQCGLTEPIAPEVKPFYDRPFSVIHLHTNIAQRLMEQVMDPEVQAIAKKGLIGSADVFSDCTDLISHTEWKAKLKELYS